MDMTNPNDWLLLVKYEDGSKGCINLWQAIEEGRLTVKMNPLNRAKVYSTCADTSENRRDYGGEEDAHAAGTFKQYLSDDVLLPPLTDAFCEAMDAARSDGCDVHLSMVIQRWQNEELIIPQIARLIDESDWPLPDRLARAHEAFMRDWEGTAYEGRHTKKPRTNWVHHVDLYKDGSIRIVRRGDEDRLYQPTEASKLRLERAMMEWTHYPPAGYERAMLLNRVMAPMRRFN